MTTIILPIKPVYSEQILNGTKKNEFRKSVPGKYVDKIIIYESAPTSGIVGEVSVTDIVSDTPDNLFNKYSEVGGISKDDYDVYYKNSTIAYGYILDKPVRYKNVENIQEFGLMAPPQNYVYVEELSPVIDMNFVRDNWQKLLQCKFYEHDVVLCGYSGNWAIIGFYDEFGCIKEFTSHVDFKQPTGCKSFRFVRPYKIKLSNENTLF